MGLKDAGLPLIHGVRVLVTASTSGIGYEVASRLAKWGAQVIISSRNSSNVARTVNELRLKGLEVYGIAADLRRKRDLEKLVNEAWRLTGGLDALIFNAGHVACEPCLIHETSYSDWVEAALIHLVAPGYLTKLFINRLLAERRGGAIVYLSSASIREPMKYFALADTARAGLVQLAKLVTRTYGRQGIRATTLLLGTFDTPGARKSTAEIARREGLDPETFWKERVEALSPIGVGDFDELTLLVAFLISPRTRFTAGATILIDGAMTKCTC